MSKSIQKFEREVIVPDPNDTLSTTLDNVRMFFQSLAKEIEKNVELIAKDLVGPMDMYCQHYQRENSELIE